MRSIIMDLCRLRDGLGTQARSVPETMLKADVAVLLESYADEIALVLEQCGVIPVRPEPLTKFDPRLHQAAGAVPAGRPDLDQAIQSVVSDGYAQAATGKAIVLPRVIVYRHTAEAGQRPDFPAHHPEQRPGIPGKELGPQERKTFASTLERAARLPRDHPDYPAVVVQAASQLVLLGMADRDPALIDQAVAMFADAAAVLRPVVRECPLVLSMLGYARQARYTLTGNTRDLAAAIDLLQEARQAAEEQPGSRYAAEIGQLLADARRLGDQAGLRYPGR
ncbi:MAG TPA: hypothetical protein VHZ03_32105 [Trebonia sp.]|nr:hypothetical protein [Trebonia sp.]